MDPRTLLHKSPPSPQETVASSSLPAQYEPPPSELASSSPQPASAPNVSLTLSSPPSSSPQESSPPRLPSLPIKSKIEGTNGGSSVTDTDEVQTGEDTGSDEPSTSSTNSAPSLPSVARPRRSAFWRFVLATRNPALPVTNPTLPVTNQQPVRLSMFRRFRQWHQSHQENLLPDGVIQVRVAVCGFAFYGIMALLGNTLDLVKEFSDNSKVLVLFSIGFIWTVATIAVPLTMSARSELDKGLSHHATRLVLLGITLHMIFNISLMLPQNVWVTSTMNIWSLIASVFLLVLAMIGHGRSWIESAVYGEVEERPTGESGNNISS